MKSGHHRSMLRGVLHVGTLTCLSKILGFAREFAFARVLGVGGLSDVFVVAFRIPNTLRRIFAEGAFSAAATPVFVDTLSVDDTAVRASTLMGNLSLILMGTLGVLCVLVGVYPEQVIQCVGIGFSAEQCLLGGKLLRILFPFILCVSLSALAASALAAMRHFVIPALGSSIINICFISGILACKYYGIDLSGLCMLVLAGSFLQLLLHWWWCWRYRMAVRYDFSCAQSWHDTGRVLRRFMGALLGVGVLELNVLIDTQIASLLPAGSISVLGYCYQFLGVPLSIFAVAFATIMLPEFARIARSTPTRLDVYMCESIKFVAWVSIPATVFLMLVADRIFVTLLFSPAVAQVWGVVAGNVLRIMSSGLLFFALNRVFKNILYALGATSMPAWISAAGVGINIVGGLLSVVLGIGLYGLACAIVLSEIMQTVLYGMILRTRYQFRLFPAQLTAFFKIYGMQVVGLTLLLVACYHSSMRMISHSLRVCITNGIWFWPVALVFAGIGGVCLLALAPRRHVAPLFLRKVW